MKRDSKVDYELLTASGNTLSKFHDQWCFAELPRSIALKDSTSLRFRLRRPAGGIETQYVAPWLALGAQVGIVPDMDPNWVLQGAVFELAEETKESLYTTLTYIRYLQEYPDIVLSVLEGTAAGHNFWQSLLYNHCLHCTGQGHALIPADNYSSGYAKTVDMFIALNAAKYYTQGYPWQGKPIRKAFGAFGLHYAQQAMRVGAEVETARLPLRLDPVTNKLSYTPILDSRFTTAIIQLDYKLLKEEVDKCQT